MTVAGDKPMLEVSRVTHRYGSTLALDDVSVTAGEGEFLTILGESGSGKTTLLRIISGLEKPTSVERIAIDGENVADLPAAKRNCTTVFQQYALFPHMSVYENVEYGLKIRGVPREEAHRRAQDALQLVRLSEKRDRRIDQLSGGEKQRVALARALVTQPAILLLDEPLGALDEKLRLDMQAELVELHKKLGMTFVYITHSQEEALTMSDRVLLIRKGRVEQSGPPEALFDRPVSRFAAEFMGFENILEGRVRGFEDDVAVIGVGEHVVRGHVTAGSKLGVGDEAFVAFRAERASLRPSDTLAENRNVLEATPGVRLYRGKYVDQTAQTAVGSVKVRVWDRTIDLDHFDRVTWDPIDCVVMAPSSGADRVRTRIAEVH